MDSNQLDPDKVCLLSDADLRKTLESLGENVGPITAFTRATIEKQLVRRLLNETEPSDNQRGNNTDDGFDDDDDVADPCIFYGVYFPDDVVLNENDKVDRVYTDKDLCVAITKKYGARFKIFSTHEEALEFSKKGPPPLNTTNSNVSSNVNSVEKPSPFRGPKSQDLVKFRKSIEKGDENYFLKCLESNPRYLVSSGDTPSILQEGSRYNALHIACRTNRNTICMKVLSVVGNPHFFQKLYPDDTMQTSLRRSSYLLDLYLNMPDKALNETPLHFAVKYGSLDCVKTLTSYTFCDKARHNKYDQTPMEIICTRTSVKCPVTERKIKELLGEQLIVPVLRDENHCLAPKVGSPCVYNIDLSASQESLNNSQEFLPGVHSSPLKVHGFAGPMCPKKAEIFYRKWRTIAVPSPVRDQRAAAAAIRITDHEKGLERDGRKLASDLDVEWNEYWEFLGEFANFSTEEGLIKLEEHLKVTHNQVINERDSFNAEQLSRNLSNIQHNELEDSVSPADTVDAIKGTFLHNNSSFGSEISSKSTIADLCSGLEALRLNTSVSPMKGDSPVVFESRRFLDELLEAEKDNKSLDKSFLSQLDSSIKSEGCDSLISYIMQSCKVTAYRLSDVLTDFIHSLETQSASNITLTKQLRSKIHPEVACLRTVIKKIDTTSIESEFSFSYIHCLVSTRCVQLLEENITPGELDKLFNVFKNIQSHVNYLDDSSSEEDDSDHTKHIIPKDEKTEIMRHFCCVVRCIFNILKFSTDGTMFSTRTNDLKIEDIDDCTCVWKPLSDKTKDNIRNNNITNNNSFTTEKYKKGHSFINYVLFNDNDNITNISQLSNNKNSSNSNKSAINNDNKQHKIVKVLSFDDEEQKPTPPGEKDDEDDNVSEADSFATATSSIEEGMETPEEIIPVYINGSFANKTDVDVLGAIDELLINENKFPYVSRWFDLVNSHSKETRESWESPYCLRRKSKLRAPDSAPGNLNVFSNKEHLTSTPLPLLRRTKLASNFGASPI